MTDDFKLPDMKQIHVKMSSRDAPAFSDFNHLKGHLYDRG